MHVHLCTRTCSPEPIWSGSITAPLPCLPLTAVLLCWLLCRTPRPMPTHLRMDSMMCSRLKTSTGSASLPRSRSATTAAASNQAGCLTMLRSSKCARTHIRKHARMHTRTHVRTHAWAHGRTGARTHTCSFARSLTCAMSSSEAVWSSGDDKAQMGVQVRRDD